MSDTLRSPAFPKDAPRADTNQRHVRVVSLKTPFQNQCDDSYQLPAEFDDSQESLLDEAVPSATNVKVDIQQYIKEMQE